MVENCWLIVNYQVGVHSALFQQFLVHRNYLNMYVSYINLIWEKVVPASKLCFAMVEFSGFIVLEIV